MSCMDTRDSLFRLMNKNEQKAYNELPLEEREYQRYVFRVTMFPPYDQKILTREEFYEQFRATATVSTVSTVSTKG